MAILHRLDTPQELAAAAADFALGVMQASVEGRGRASIALAGGSTPAATYRGIADSLPASAVDPKALFLFWGDERCVPPDDPQSNYRMAHSAWLGRSAIPGGQIHRLACEGDARRGADRYDQLLRSHFRGMAAPRFDLILLGLGSDGHTASLFPGSALLAEQERWVAADFVATGDGWRATLTPPAINAARTIAFLVQGEAKAEAVRQVILGDHDPSAWPAQIVEPADGELHWFLDEAAAGLL